jgi:nucleolar pre-ribosomal-associated protein 1
MGAIVRHAYSLLVELEATVDGPVSEYPIGRAEEASGLPHRAYGAHQETPTIPTLASWSHYVQALWQAAMTVPQKAKEWDGLSARMVLWRALAGEHGTAAGEWARRETIRMLQVS